jgi:hypothetical protein
VKTFGIEQTQEIESMTQDFDLSPLSSVHSTRTPSQSSSAIWDLPSSGAPVSSVTSAPANEGWDTDTQKLQDMMIRNATTADDTEMLGELFSFV